MLGHARCRPDRGSGGIHRGGGEARARAPRHREKGGGQRRQRGRPTQRRRARRRGAESDEKRDEKERTCRGRHALETAGSVRGVRGARATDDAGYGSVTRTGGGSRSEEHTSELQSQSNLVCRLLLEKK